VTQPTRRLLLLAAVTSLASHGARAQAVPAEVAAELPGAKVQGSSTLRFFGLRVYDARLWTGAAALATDWTATPFALELEYARELKGELIAERSLTEMRRQGEIAAETGQRWLDLMKSLFPDVKGGDRITGLNRPGQGARFFVNGKLRGESGDGDFARFFFGIWLSPRTSEPAMRKALLGTGS
jgi:Chalcone isomerase-like